MTEENKVINEIPNTINTNEDLQRVFPEDYQINHIIDPSFISLRKNIFIVRVYFAIALVSAMLFFTLQIVNKSFKKASILIFLYCWIGLYIWRTVSMIKEYKSQRLDVFIVIFDFCMILLFVIATSVYIFNNEYINLCILTTPLGLSLILNLFYCIFAASKRHIGYRIVALAYSFFAFMITLMIFMKIEDHIDIGWVSVMWPIWTLSLNASTHDIYCSKNSL